MLANASYQEFKKAVDYVVNMVLGGLEYMDKTVLLLEGDLHSLVQYEKLPSWNVKCCKKYL